MIFKEKCVMFFASGCYVGYIPFMPGTFGSLLGIPICCLLSPMTIGPAVFITVVLILISIQIADKAEKLLNKTDPGCIVIDEIAGMTVSLTGLPCTLQTVVIGFFLFRILDVFKPFPIRNIEKSLHGGAGVVLDDVAAGIGCNLMIRIAMDITGFLS